MINNINPLGQIFINTCSKYPNKLALISNDNKLTYSQLKDLVINCALNLTSHGVKSGDLVSISKLEIQEFEVICSIALTMLGCTWIELNTECGINTNAKFILVQDDFKYENFPIIKITKTFFKRPEDINLLKSFNLTGYSHDNEAWYLATSSGSSGKPKLMAITSMMLYERIISYTEYDNLNNPVIMSFFPTLSHVHQLYMWFCIYKAGTYLAVFNESLLAKPDFISGSPSHFKSIIDSIDKPDKPFLKEARVTGANLKPELLKTLLYYFKSVRTAYGTTETGSITMKLFDKSTDKINVGKAYSNINLEVVDENNFKVKENIEGIIRVKTTAQIKEYFMDDLQTNKSFKMDGTILEILDILMNFMNYILRED